MVVVDDDRLLGQTVARLLEHDGMEARAFGCAADAVAFMEASRPEVAAVVTDVSMPGTMDGIGLAAWVARWHPGVPVVVMSAEADRLAGAARIPGVIGCLEKPPAPERLVGLLARARLTAGGFRAARHRSRGARRTH